MYFELQYLFWFVKSKTRFYQNKKNLELQYLFWFVKSKLVLIRKIKTLFLDQNYEEFRITIIVLFRKIKNSFFSFQIKITRNYRTNGPSLSRQNLSRTDLLFKEKR